MASQLNFHNEIILNILMQPLRFLQTKFEKISLLLVMLFCSVFAVAQDANTAVTTTTTKTTTEEWYTNPLYLVIGAILFIILIAAIARGNKSRS